VTDAELVLRPATTADFPAIEAIYVAAEQAPPGGSPAPAGWMTRYLEHLLDRGEVLVADRESVTVGFAAVVDIGRAVHLADLFVDPSRHGTGIGGRLLREALGDRWPRMTFSSDDPRAMPLYIKAGMLPRWPNIYLDSEGRRIPGAESTLEAMPVSPSEAAKVEVSFGGADRQRDWEHWAGQPGGQSFVLEDGGRPIAVGNSRDRWRNPGRWMDRLILAPGLSDLVSPVLAALHFGGRGQPISIAIPGPLPAVRVLVDAGFRMFDRDTFMASEDGLLDPLHHIVEPGVP
jgi:ribosomal protein S18 acetylase RimI-like enzyme